MKYFMATQLWYVPSLACDLNDRLLISQQLDDLTMLGQCHELWINIKTTLGELTINANNNSDKYLS